MPRENAKLKASVSKSVLGPSGRPFPIGIKIHFQSLVYPPKGFSRLAMFYNGDRKRICIILKNLG